MLSHIQILKFESMLSKEFKDLGEETATSIQFLRIHLEIHMLEVWQKIVHPFECVKFGSLNIHNQKVIVCTIQTILF